MKHRFLFALLVVALSLPALAQNKNKEKDWIEVRSPHFQVFTDAGLTSGRAVALRFERMRQVFGWILMRADVRSGVPLTVIAFRDTAEFRRNLPSWQGKPMSASGLCVRSNDVDYILLDLSDPNAASATLHEYVHAVLSANTAPMPLWYDEGVAEFFSTIEVRLQDVRLGRQPDYVEAVLHDHKLLPAAAFLALAPSSPENNGQAAPDFNEAGAHQSLYYAQSWLTISWLVANHRLPAVNEYARLALVEHVPPAAAFRRAFNLDPAEFDRQLAEYYAAGPRDASLPIPTGLDDISTYAYSNRKLAPLEAEVALADFRLHTHDFFAQGVAELEAILRQDALNAGAHRSLGYAYLRQADLDRASEQFTKAADLGTGDARVHYYAAALIARRGNLEGGGVASFKVKEHLLKAIDLDPDYGDAWSLLARAYAADGKLTEAIADMLKAIRLSPRSESDRLALAAMYTDSRRWDDALALLAYLQDSHDPAVVAGVAAERARLEQVRNSPPHAARRDERPRPSTYDDPKWSVPEARLEAKQEDDEKPPVDLKPDPRPILYVKGKLVRAACQPGGAAVLTVAAGKQTLQLATPDYRTLVVLGADAFSCSWHDVPIAANYRASSAGAGDLVSLALQ
jgi:tetratricopeptide (TPR) repeat protein